MEVINDILGYKNRKIYQNDDYFLFSLDSIMLANFVTIRKRDKKILDLGTGNGVIPLIMTLRCDKKIECVEIQKPLYELAMKSIKYNNLDDRIVPYNIDMKDFVTSNNCNQYDLITCNPPFFKNYDKFLNEINEKAIARHEIKITLEEVISISSKLLSNDGNLAIVNRPDRLVEMIEYMKKYKIEPKRMRFVYETIDKESTLVLLEGQKNGKSGLKIENPFILKENGYDTLEYTKIKEVPNETKEL